MRMSRWESEIMKSFIGNPINIDGEQLLINPGSGPVEGKTVEHARKNILQIILDAGFSLDEIEVAHCAGGDGGGRCSFELKCNNYQCRVRMPGLELSQVRYTGSDDQLPFDFPRLFVGVGGLSWLWMFAVNHIKDDLKGGE